MAVLSKLIPPAHPPWAWGHFSNWPGKYRDLTIDLWLAYIAKQSLA